MSTPLLGKGQPAGLSPWLLGDRSPANERCVEVPGLQLLQNCLVLCDDGACRLGEHTNPGLEKPFKTSQGWGQAPQT